ncbi:MAG: septal ring lytic transglycosylase RlpA family lipoprotein [Thermodesulfobacterium geofontis]|uniref:Probable endolytic peptidoglycan transglycosylase RlpA n=1 Tax=Thermodesulfobacterium geofontis TaxID=1295609 RepID=A0A2N7QG90_9BACT|nr:MAG: septal ring lytic transglycosylase RlpA family lipoprotein [Thermodesulfobacterium geofontis]PMP97984.1 MAG: septal ring lytic transglycosylase RlpA family lipoprotein [Thermodesulfobacterium geofontis]
MKRLLYFILILTILSGCARPPRTAPEYSYEDYSRKVPGWLKPYTIDGKTYFPLPSAEGYEEVCIASWYGPGFHQNQSSSGEIYDMHDFTAAHKILPLGTYVLVKNLENGKQIVVRINDRGPFVEDRCIDLSYAAAKELGIIEKGLAKVKIVALSEGILTDEGIVYKNIPNIRFREFYLQVGAFKNYQNAWRLKLELEREFEKVKIEPFQKEGICFYRVQIYLAEDLYKALNLAEELKRGRFRSAFLVAK